MTEVVMVRHAQARYNVGDLSQGNMESSLTTVASTKRGMSGQAQALGLASRIYEDFGIVPEEYDAPVAASRYRRTYQTLQLAGFKQIEVVDLIDEALPTEGMTGTQIIEKHATERWVPDEVAERAARFIDLARSGQLRYKFYCSHSLFIAAMSLQLSDEAAASGREFDIPFSEERGFMPRFAQYVRHDV